MQVHKRTEITIETSELMVVRRARIYRAWCAQCGKEVEMVEGPNARAIAKLPGEAAHPATWHVYEEQSVELVCMESVLKGV